MSPEILFLGGTSVDLIKKQGQTLFFSKNPKKRHQKRCLSLIFIGSVGGGITNSSVIASKLGLKVAMLSKVGKDFLGRFAVKELKRCGVDTSGMIIDPRIRTSIALARIDKKGNSRYVFYKSPAKDSIVPLKNVPKALLKNCRIFHFGSSFSYQKESSVEALRYVKYLKKRGVFISFDPNIRPYAIKDRIEARKRVLGFLKKVDMARISEIDLEFLTGRKNPEKGLRILKKLTKCRIILTLGSRGSGYLDDSGNFIKIPAFKVKVVDTIGAGDAFNAALIYEISKIGEKRVFSNLKPSLRFASKVSAIVCTKSGSNF